MEKVSFDFDETLDDYDVQVFAAELANRGYETWVVTSRLPDGHFFGMRMADNHDLYNVCKAIGIPKDRIVFTSGGMKSEYFKDKDFVWHLDDDQTEIFSINDETETKGVHKQRPAAYLKADSIYWERECRNLLGIE